MTVRFAPAFGPRRAAPRPYPVMIIDDHQLFSTSLRMALHLQGYDAGEVPIAELTAALSLDCHGPAGLVVLDLDLGQDARGRWLRGCDLVAGLTGLGWRVLIVSGADDQAGLAAAIAAGAVGALAKSSSFEALLDAVAKVAAGQPVLTEAQRQWWVARHRVHQERERKLSRRLDRLSAREGEVLELLAEGHRASAIAERFVVSMTTVRTQIRAILTKLEVNSQLEAVALLRQTVPRDRTT